MEIGRVPPHFQGCNFSWTLSESILVIDYRLKLGMCVPTPENKINSQTAFFGIFIEISVTMRAISNTATSIFNTSLREHSLG